LNHDHQHPAKRLRLGTQLRDRGDLERDVRELPPRVVDHARRLVDARYLEAVAAQVVRDPARSAPGVEYRADRTHLLAERVQRRP
jgi:hypothetical protein